MQTKNTLAILAAILAGTAPLAAQVKPTATNDPYVLELLRRTIDEQKKNPDKIVRPPDTTATGSQPKLLGATSPEIAALENQYIQGKITAKQFQKALETLQLEQERREKAAAQPVVARPAVGTAVSPRAAAAAGVTPPAPPPAFPTPPPQPNPNQKKLTDVEVKIEEMMRMKIEREKAAKEAAATAALTNNPSGAPLSKRQRLDALLKQVVDGKLTDAEYREQRNKIVAEPD